jgi:plasmid stability protein
MASQELNPDKETILIRGLPPHVEKSLIERATERGCDVADEAEAIIEQHVADRSDGFI